MWPEWIIMLALVQRRTVLSICHWCWVSEWNFTAHVHRKVIQCHRQCWFISHRTPYNIIQWNCKLYVIIWKDAVCTTSLAQGKIRFKSSSPGQNGRHFADDIFRCIFLNESVWISITISLKFFPKGPINNIPALVQIMAWHRIGNKPLSEAILTRITDAYMLH